MIIKRKLSTDIFGKKLDYQLNLISKTTFSNIIINFHQNMILQEINRDSKNLELNSNIENIDIKIFLYS